MGMEDHSSLVAENENPHVLLKQEIHTLSKRVDALIDWVEKYEESLISSAQPESKKEKRDKSGCIVYETGEEAVEIPGLVKEDKLQDPFLEDSVMENKDTIGNGDNNNEELDLFGANSSFGKIQAENEEVAKPISLLQWD